MRKKDSHTPIRRALRRNSTKAERLLWRTIRGSSLGYKIRRQFSIGACIADFYCHELRLVIELDGYSHNDDKVYAKDIAKQNFLKKMGYAVKRYTDEQVLNSIESVYMDLKALCDNLAHLPPHPNPLPQGEGTE